jgi:hypothetical protein
MKADATGNYMKYYLSIGAIFKDEAGSMEEWLKHYILRGIDHFYLINDNSSDNYLEIVEKYKDKITLFDFDKTTDIYIKGGRQPRAYHKCFSPILKESEWFLICDLDEYVWCPNGFCLKKELETLSDKYNCVHLLGPHFGSNNHKNQPLEIVNSFDRRQALSCDDKYTYEHNIEKFLDPIVKQMVKSNSVEFFGIHTHILKGEYKILNEKKIPLNNCKFRLNHYMTQSEERWRNNLKKTDACSRPLKNQPRSSMEQFFILNESYNLIEDRDLIIQNNLHGQ